MLRVSQSSQVAQESQISKRAPAVVSGFNPAIARRFIAVSAANRANSFTIAKTNALHRQEQQHLFTKYVFHFKPAAFIKTDFRFTFVDSHLFLACQRRGWTVKQIETLIQ